MTAVRSLDIASSLTARREADSNHAGADAVTNDADAGPVSPADKDTHSVGW
jgi:hypothetical protein